MTMHKLMTEDEMADLGITIQALLHDNEAVKRENSNLTDQVKELWDLIYEMKDYIQDLKDRGDMV